MESNFAFSLGLTAHATDRAPFACSADAPHVDAPLPHAALGGGAALVGSGGCVLTARGSDGGAGLPNRPSTTVFFDVSGGGAAVPPPEDDPHGSLLTVGLALAACGSLDAPHGSTGGAGGGAGGIGGAEGG